MRVLNLKQVDPPDRQAYRHLLLLADESEEMLETYWQTGEMFAGFDKNQHLIGVALLLPITNIAVAPNVHGMGYGSNMGFDNSPDISRGISTGSTKNKDLSVTTNPPITPASRKQQEQD